MKEASLRIGTCDESRKASRIERRKKRAIAPCWIFLLKFSARRTVTADQVPIYFFYSLFDRAYRSRRKKCPIKSMYYTLHVTVEIIFYRFLQLYVRNHILRGFEDTTTFLKVLKISMMGSKS